VLGPGSVLVSRGRRESLYLKTAGIRNNDKVTKAQDKNSVGELPKTHQLKWA